MNEDPPTAVVSVKLGSMPSYSARFSVDVPAVNSPLTSFMDIPASSSAYMLPRHGVGDSIYPVPCLSHRIRLLRQWRPFSEGRSFPISSYCGCFVKYSSYFRGAPEPRIHPLCLRHNMENQMISNLLLSPVCEGSIVPSQLRRPTCGIYYSGLRQVFIEVDAHSGLIRTPGIPIFPFDLLGKEFVCI